MEDTFYIIFSTILIFSLTSCDPTFSVEFEVDNSSPYRLEIRHQHFSQDSIVTNIISGHTKLIFFSEFGIGTSTEGFMENIEELPFEEFEIIVLDTVKLNLEEAEFGNWLKEFPRKKSGVGVISLRLRRGHFE